MKSITIALVSGLSTLALSIFAESSTAQVIPDGTVGSIVSPTNVITGGTRSGNNLFHSFSQFSIPTNSSAFFNNATDVQNIFSRVTGTSQSSIDGILKAQGTANLFLMNPNGIVFGPNAQLQLGGSFLGTTASGIKFADGIEFNTANSTPALLSVNVPIGLQMGTNSREIKVNGPGHKLIRRGVFAPIDGSNNPAGLSVGIDRSLVLVGGKVNLSGGILSTQGGGHLEIGSVEEGQVKLNPLGMGWSGDYSNVKQFSDIYLAQQSLVNATGLSGSIKLVGKNISLTEASTVMSQSFGSTRSGGINIQANGTLMLNGVSQDGQFGSIVFIDNFGTGTSGNVDIVAAQINLSEGASIANQTFSPSVGGDVTINTTGPIVLDGFLPTNPVSISSIGTTTYSSKNAGQVNITASNLSILNGAVVASATVGSGQSGTVRLNVSGTVEVAGTNGITLAPSALVSISVGSGNAKDVLINTSRLVVREGGLIGSTAYVTADAGNVIINASESVLLKGRANGSVNASRIVSTAEILDPATQAAYGFPPIPTGNAGSLVINTPALRITDEAYITVKNDGPGKAGDLEINSGSVFLSQGSINASTASGNGGNIRLNIQDSVLLRHGSNISATAAGSGAGGNLFINAPIIVGLENSDIIANAVNGRGGNIQITTQGILGLKYRTALTPENDITASSEFGINGSVQVNTIGIDPTNALNELPSDVVDSSRQIADRCGAARTSSFTVTGRGGMPQNPMKKQGSDRSWHDLRTPMVSDRPEVIASQSDPMVVSKIQHPESKIVEASRIQINADGSIALVDGNPIDLANGATCSGISNQ